MSSKMSMHNMSNVPKTKNSILFQNKVITFRNSRGDIV